MVLDHQSGYYGRRNLEINHSDLNCQSRFLLAFCHDFYSSLYRQEKMLEIGGGGAIYPLISARLKLDEIIYAENNLWCRNSVRRWLDGERKSHDWNPFFELVRMLEGNREPISKMISHLKEKLQTVVPSDVLAPRCGLSSELGEKFDVVSSHFCPQGIYETVAQFELGLSNIASLVAPGGYLVTSLLDEPASPPRQDNAQAPSWTDQMPRITPKRMKELLSLNKFDVVMERHSGFQIRGVQEPADLGGTPRYSGLMCIAAKKSE